MTLLAVCHDAGGAEVVAAWLAGEDGDGDRAATARAVLGGPARAVFARRVPEVPVLDALPSLGGVDLVVCGSSGAADLERRAVAAARAAGVRCAVWLDHWVNFRERFVLDGALVLPDEVWVCDAEAERIARAALPPEARIVERGNPYLDAVVAEVHAAAAAAGRPPGDGPRALYVAEPTSSAALRLTGDPLGFGYDEHGALARWLALAAADENGVSTVRLRPHPSEPSGKYDNEVAAAPLPVALSDGTTLAQDVAWADVVVGCDTMALVVALAAGRRVVSAIPPGGRPLSLPFAAIERV